MHQTHNIPWDLIASNFTFKEDDKRFTPPATGLTPKNNPNAAQELKHFCRKFASAIRTFSETERAKYPRTIQPRPSGDLFSNEIRDKHPEFLNEKNQKIENWINKASKTYSNEDETVFTYDTSDGDLADVVKVLISENIMEPLLMLAKHPNVPIDRLHYLSWGHHFGWSRVRESALQAYMLFNTAEATGTLVDGSYAKAPLFGWYLGEVATSMDYPGHQVPHREFLAGCGAFFGECGEVKGRWDGNTYRADWARNHYVHLDYGRLQEYVKLCFALLYRYDVLMRECGLDPEWEFTIAKSEPICKVVKIHHRWDEEAGKWVQEFL